MKVDKSHVSFNNFSIVNCSFKNIPLDDKYSDYINLETVLENIPISLDYDVYYDVKDSHSIDVCLNIAGNNSDHPRPGYKFTVITQGHITTDDEIKKEEVDQYIQDTAIPQMIDNVRLYLINMTGHKPYGTYTLPDIDFHSKQKRNN